MQLVKPAASCNWGMLKLLFWAVMHPSCVVRTQWDLYVLAVLFSVCIITPFVICFDLNVMPVSALGAFGHALLWCLRMYAQAGGGSCHAHPAFH